ncbi:class I SAM-dependent methyltransferase [Gloeobacter kilaueensis]|uniref:Methyltransferase n=1 Tax=Gloeobacter kilaueensis (strain ATCC BAA-2537 / CCAP 1431/1 / ULC 316 / JS1) TaxID=1183438 RepID=U5QFU0_GLOK1|nr:class I SAM-dependent methyltransferase [Gloeobacter kilaueensis]AGY56484.1 methyltransferase [Gloeobacter kilaueensis JS1]
MTTGGLGFADLEDWYRGPLGGRYLERCWQVARELLEPLAGIQVLDAGCGAGHYSERLVEAGARVQGIDPDAGLVKQAQQRVPQGQFTVAPIEQLPFEPGPFERLLCSNVLEFVADPVRALAELRRVSQSNAWAVVIVLAEHSLWQWQQQLFRPFSTHPYYQGQFFSATRLEQQSRAAGWRLEKLLPAVQFPPLPVAPLLDWSEGHFANACWVARLCTD